jgi:hypothetical protein
MMGCWGGYVENSFSSFFHYSSTLITLAPTANCFLSQTTGLLPCLNSAPWPQFHKSGKRA